MLGLQACHLRAMLNAPSIVHRDRSHARSLDYAYYIFSATINDNVQRTWAHTVFYQHFLTDELDSLRITGFVFNLQQETLKAHGSLSDQGETSNNVRPLST